MPNQYMKSPCGGDCKCPFRRDCLPGWLGADRAKEIALAPSFQCHKNNSKECAGHMIVTRSFGFRLLRGQVDGKELVFKTMQEFVDHHSDD